ncbi:nucleoside/nucleotide kinase family protein [Nitriliruptoraceae bacterium ZYF776]|nr:nucleoside/nucleotide kinase family protein [Profundirhabdus halotolerans]
MAAAQERLHERLAEGARVRLGIVGAPGAGKSTLAEALVAASRVPAALLPQDGFHLATSELVRRGIADRKGAPDTFDAAGLVAALRRVAGGEDVLVPRFERDLEEPIAGALLVPASAQLVVVEGNYLLLDDPAWRPVAELLDEVWYLEVDETVRVDGLVARHVRFGRSEADARDWADRVDGANARVIAAGRSRADVVVRR